MIVPLMTKNVDDDVPVFGHVPVMADEVLEYLNPGEGKIFVDGTLGCGGHSLAIAERLGASGCLIGIDRDINALEIARQKLSAVPAKCHFIHQDFRHIDQVLDDLGIDQVDGILLDLGVSSIQLDNPQRGFSLRADGPLDMRMDQESYISAYDLINSLSEREISAIIRDFGQERFSSRIAHALINARMEHPIETTRELRKIVLRAIPNGRARQRIHPATRTFQAFRIAVNRELESLNEALNKCAELLRSGGRIGVIAFHSLEDKIVKEKFKALAKEGRMSLVVKKPLTPNERESSGNPRSRSARFRVAEKM